MKNLILSILLLSSVGVFAQCDALSAKSYKITIGAGKPDKNGNVTCKINIENKTGNNLNFDVSLWGAKPGTGKAAKITGDGVLVGPAPAILVGKKTSVSKTVKIKADAIAEGKVKVTNKDCKDTGKNTFSDPTFYKATN